MKPSGSSKIGFAEWAEYSLEVNAGVTPVLHPKEPLNRFASSPSDGQTDHRENSSAPFFYEGMRLGAAEQSAYETWDRADRPSWKDLILSARVNAIDSSAWKSDVGESTSSVFVYEGVPLGGGERRAYEEWVEPGQPSWQELVVNARIEELDTSTSIPNEYSRLQEEFRSDAPKRKRTSSIDKKDGFPEPFEFDGMRLGSPEREAYENWSKPQPPSWKDLIVDARLQAIGSSTWLNESNDSSVFEYEGVPLGEGERLAYEKWLEPAQPGWEDLVVDARVAELHSASMSCEHERGKDVASNESGRMSGAPINGKQVLRAFVYDGVALGAAERAAHDRWSKPDRPTWEDLIIDARQAAIEGDAVSNPAIGKIPSSVFVYEGMSLGDAERQAYGRWRQLAQPRWQNLVVNARLAELDPSAWILDEHDPFEDGEAVAPPSEASTARNILPILDNQPASRRPGLARDAAQETAHVQNPACAQLETRRTLNFGSSGPDSDQTAIIAGSNRLEGASKVKRLGTKSHRAATATAYDAISSANGLSSDEGCLTIQSPQPEKAVRSRNDNIGTYGSRKNERARLATETGKYESEHIFGFKVVHNTLRATKEGRRLERPMPAYLECKELHRQHVGTGRRRTGLIGRGWPDDASYRSDQRATLSDPVASAEGATASNGYQLNQLGYAHQLANDGLQSESPNGVTMPIQVATTSYNYTVSRDPVLSPPSKEQAPQLLHLGPRGQTEAVLARETALTGRWPTLEREQQVYREFLALYDVKKNLDAKPLGMRKKKTALVSALDRTAGLIGASPSKAQSSSAKDDNTIPHDERRVYDPRDRGRAEHRER
ncbi:MULTISPECIES: virA/G regulated protein [Rhizobium]|uniref:virA/G regulated protein n=1 Tax=Rhizobium TaxID=379 RepID=UPI0015723159|nr:MULTISPECIES: virA/G regulated protein [Rhizobium]MBO9126483.1 virA/G regulated protein [Rhizobium sp. 16-488-2b]MBO9178418.1 virA/G regulated protein [Rhizobium sp. 16-488-2a]MBO9194963.1 virA/G regulated protein [Rhizobium sp. 16-449-1b]NTH68701.1 virA/G regulated protein [Rhizobium rhizogenes]NTI39678.1 virA/G regulated protein [Rhizobium rhizogenes]